MISTQHKQYPCARRLYEQSFPFNEQREEPLQKRVLEHPQYHFGLLYDKDVFAGLLLYWEHTDFVYIEHFCILPQLRGKGYGAQALALLAQAGKPIILEIDPPKDAVSQRRKAFYERAGYCPNPFAHQHPPYHKGMKAHALQVMSYPAPLTAEEYEVFCGYLSRQVMAEEKALPKTNHE